MALTDAQVKAMGFGLPVGSDLINQGDNEISKNARTAAEALHKLEGGYLNPIELLPGADLYALRTPGWYFSRSTANSQEMLDLPPQIDPGPFTVHVVTTSRNLTTQTYYGYSTGASTGMFYRLPNNASGTGMTNWNPFGGGGEGSTVMSGSSNTIYQQSMRDHYGQVTTEGKAAWALRIDHGLKNFDSIVRPLLEARDIPYSLALNPGDWGLSENSGVTPAMVDGWITGGPVPVEIINHAMHHLDASTPGMLEEYIIDSKALLEEQLPAAAGKIFGFCQPGAGGSNFMGFDGGGSYESMAGTYAGQLIFGNHAYATGHLTGTSRRVLDGRIKNGMAHFTIDKQLAQRIKFEIDNAINTGVGTQMMLHPSLLNTADALTTAGLVEVLDYVAAKRDSGDLAVLSTYEMVLADKWPQGGYLVDETTGRTVKVWDYLNNREQLIYGDTGNRDITPGGLLAGSVQIHRKESGVWFRVAGGVFDGSGNLSLAALIPAGFRPTTMQYVNSVAYWASERTFPARISASGGTLEIRGYIAGTPTNFIGYWDTPDPWPSTLPGTALGSIPS